MGTILAAFGKILLLPGIVLLVSGCRTALKPLPPKEARTYQSLLEWSHENGMPGAVLLVQTRETNFLGAVGWADVKRKIPMRPDHEFRIGSITKMFTGLTIVQLEKAGLLKTDLVITNYLPRSVTDHITNSDRITVRELLQHRSGIYDFMDHRWVLRYAVLDRRGNWPPLRHLKYAYDKRASFPPGEGYEYSNSNFILLGLIIDHVTGHSHSIEIRNRFLDPLQLTNTYYELNEPARGERTHGYERFLGFSLDTYGWTPITGGGMGLVSTVSDLGAFVRHVGNRMRPSGNPAAGFPASGADWGVSWQRADHADATFSEQNGTSVFFGHAGAVPGYLCFAWHDPKNDITIVWFGSSTIGSDSGASGRFEAMLERALFDLAIEETVAKKNESQRTENARQRRPAGQLDGSGEFVSPDVSGLQSDPAVAGQGKRRQH